MMTINKFASLCGCNTQTLRYYDKVDLLKPIKVDSWSGYRYYEKSQAVDFVKIKNLQAADFTINEIKSLLKLPDQQVFDAFEQKIAEQSQKLERIKEIQRSYLTEKTNMEKLVKNVADYLLHAISDYEMLREFGLSPEEGTEIVAKLRDYIEKKTAQYLPAEPDVHMIVDSRVIRGAENVADAFATLDRYDDTVLLGDETVSDEDPFDPEICETVWEHHGWNFVYEFLNDIPHFEAGCNYCFYFRLTDDKYSEGLEFPMFMIAAMLPRADADEITMGCAIKHSDDNQNHFLLLRAK